VVSSVEVDGVVTTTLTKNHDGRPLRGEAGRPPALNAARAFGPPVVQRSSAI